MGNQNQVAVLGLDIGSNSVGSAWVELKANRAHLAASVFPAGVDEKEGQRGTPKNQARRLTRGQRRTIDRRGRRKRLLQKFLIDSGLLPKEQAAFTALLNADPWHLRVAALSETSPISPHEFGRICLHMAQRRGAFGINVDLEDNENDNDDKAAADGDDGKIKEGMKRLNAAMKEKGAETFAQFIVALSKERTTHGTNARGEAFSWRDPIRNRQYRMPEDQQYYAGRDVIRDEFHKIVNAQRGQRSSALAKLLTDDLIRKLDDPKGNATWRNSGLLFGQRRIYWDLGTLGRCDLEPTERCIPIADRHASYYRVVESVNNIRIEHEGSPSRALTADERQAVIDTLRGPLFRKSKGAMVPKASASVTDIKQALGIPTRDKSVHLNIEADKDRAINTDWFHRAIVHGAIGVDRWHAMDDAQKESVNRAILKFDPEEPKHEEKLRKGALEWWNLDEAAADALVAAWQRRPKLEKRLNLSRRAILNLLPLMETFDHQNQRWPTQQEARKAYAATLPNGDARMRYETGAPGLTARDRYYMKLDKHRITADLPALPPAPTLSNPVVRKAIHEVRRHVMAWMKKFGRRPDRVMIEMARETTDSEKRRNDALARNRSRNKIRTEIIDEVLPLAFGEAEAHRLTLNQQRSAVDRVILARQQDQTCPYCGRRGITDIIAAKRGDLEIDHIAPYSRTGDNGLNNKVVVHKTCNQGKTNKTPREWWADAYDDRVLIAMRLFKDAKPDKGDYFRFGDYKRKWENFSREISPEGEWRTSQLSDTAYAARQVAAYLADALYDGRGLTERGDGGDRQRIFFTQGKFTSRLRKDWQLYETILPSDAIGTPDRTSAEERLALMEKDRGDHRQHAIDAAAIALTDPAIKFKLANQAKDDAEYRELHGQWPIRAPIPAPWGNVESFRLDILSQVYPHLRRDGENGTPASMIVAHRPVKRRLVGAFHKQTQYGPVFDNSGKQIPDRVTVRQPIYKSPLSSIKQSHLRMAIPETEAEARSRIAADLRRNGRTSADAKAEADRIVNRPGFRPKQIEPKPGKTGIVRDATLRKTIREQLLKRGLNPDRFTPQELGKTITKDGPICHSSGVPIKSAVLLWANSEPVVIKRRVPSARIEKREVSGDPRTLRIYDGQNNHHIAIRADRKSGKWRGEIVPTFAATRQVRIEKKDAVDRSDNDKTTFVMSLAEGEMIYARRPDRPDEPPGYFVVCKLDKPARVHFAPHWDARKASEQDRWAASAAQLASCGPEPGTPPQKVYVSPLGEATPLEKD